MIHYVHSKRKEKIVRLINDLKIILQSYKSNKHLAVCLTKCV